MTTFGLFSTHNKKTSSRHQPDTRHQIPARPDTRPARPAPARRLASGTPPAPDTSQTSEDRSLHPVAEVKDLDKLALYIVYASRDRSKIFTMLPEPGDAGHTAGLVSRCWHTAGLAHPDGWSGIQMMPTFCP